MKLKRIIILLLVAIMLPVISKAFDINLSVDKPKVKKDEEIVLSIKNSENVIAGNFEINYNEKAFELVEGLNIECAEKDGKIACIYADITGKGSDEFKIKFKAKKTGEFSINNAKIRTDSREESYTDNEIKGINDKIEVKVESNLVIIAIIGIIFIIGIACIIKVLKKR